MRTESIARNLPDRLEGHMTAVRRFRNDEGGSVPAGTNRPRFERTDEEYENLARDPSHGDQVSPASQAERDVGLGLEERGEIPGPIRRDPTGGAEFIDADGGEWDVKAYNSNFPNGFDLDRIEDQLDRSRRLGENVMIDTRNLAPDDLASLRDLVDANELNEIVRFWP